MYIDTIDGPMNNSMFLRHAFKTAQKGFQHIGMLPIGIFDPLNRQIRMCIANALCFCADHNDDIIDTNRIQGLDDR